MSMTSVVLSAFPGTGKSYLYEAQDEYGLKIADSDSSQFSWLEKGVRDPAFPENYIQHLQSIIGEYDIILVSSHETVRNAMEAAGIDFYTAFPDISQKELYLERFRKRGSDEAFIKLLSDNWENWINALMQDEKSRLIRIIDNHWDTWVEEGRSRTIILHDGEYLSDVILTDGEEE